MHRYWSVSADGRELRTAVTSFSAVALAEVGELARYRDRADGAAAAELRRAYDWMRRAGLTLHHRDTITRIAGTPSVRVTRRVHDQFARPLEITELLVDAQRDALVYEFTVPAAV
ncbi:gntR-family transcriptional regulator [Streptomyces viridosporus ATCC 14672]|uniref:GntR-family transcriptional regulator n=1 Tax=Streptomyces viridosporus (strain ATCC 14672 / DSM 40746 / JCM 4963 / KCTC 9882 / NRRL B-12104 / FH 1290) TaxID=566461 RepID=D5ZY95_STRV1|nr:gntR-family transcriptional regulator [Streptomyces viridosporus ATCC 14672]